MIYGSSTSGPGGTGGSWQNFGGASDGLTPWGGSSDVPPDTTISLKDQWHRQRPPLDDGDLPTRGAIATVASRIVRTSSNLFSIYSRDYTFDAKGALALIDVETEAVSGGIAIPMHPWQCYITALAANSCSVKINPNSTLMQTWDYRTYWKDALWKDAWTHASITNFTDTFTLTTSDSCVWMEVVFVSGDISTVTIKNGVPGAVTWNSDLRYVSADNGVLGTGSFTWYQLLAYFKPSASGDGGSEVDAVFNGVNYKLMCPTTTHLMQSYVFGSIYPYADQFNPAAHFAIIPWHGCWFPTS